MDCGGCRDSGGGVTYYAPRVNRVLYPLSYVIAELRLTRYAVLQYARTGELKPIAKLPGGMLLYEWNDIQEMKVSLAKARLVTRRLTNRNFAKSLHAANTEIANFLAREKARKTVAKAHDLDRCSVCGRPDPIVTCNDNGSDVRCKICRRAEMTNGR